MKHIEKRTETVTREYVTKTTCDMCGSVIPQQWAGEIDDITVERKTGFSSSDGGSGDLVSVDLCSDCFTGKLVPWLESQGVKVQKTEWDW